MTDTNGSFKLRPNAEGIAPEKAAQLVEKFKFLSVENVQQAIHELQVHQIELQMQNEELRRTHMELDALRARYFDLYNLAPVSCFTLNEQGLIVDANRTAATLLAIERGELIEQPFTRFIRTEDQALYYRYRSQLIETGKPLELDQRMVNNNGTVFWGHLTATIARDGASPPLCHIILSDITERKQLEEDLRRSEERYRALVETTSDCIWEINPQGCFTYLSPKFTEMMGYSPMEFQGKSPLALIADEKQEVQEQVVAAMAAQQPFSSLQIQARRLDGGFITVEVSGVPIFTPEGEYRGIRGIARDITKRKRAEKQLSKAEAYARNLIEINMDPLVMIDPDGKISDVNRASMLATGFSREEMIGTDFSAYFTDPDKARAGYCMVFEQGMVRDYPLEIRHRDGHLTPVLYNASVFLDETQQIAGVFAAARDITQLKRAEEELKAINDELEQRVEQRTLELQETQKQYLHAEKLSAIGKLSASIAHEFNNPLQGILSILKGLKKRAILENEDRELLNAAIAESDRIKELIRSLQDFNRPTTGRIMAMEVHKAIDSLLLMNRSEFKSKRISVALDYAEQLPQILAVPDQIKQVFLNLLTNAVDACHLRGGMITISTRQAGDQVVVAFKDTGTGIRPEEIERIFQPFYTTKPAVKGTGLGLSVSYGIVKSHQGEIQVKSQPGAGSTFTVLLPINAKTGR